MTTTEVPVLTKKEKASDDLEGAVQTIAFNWPHVVGDPNVQDVLYLAYSLQGALGIRELPHRLASKKSGVSWVESVDRHLIQGNILRFLSPEEVGAPLRAAVERSAPRVQRRRALCVRGDC